MDIISHDFSLTDLGLGQPRLEGEEYLSIVDEFMEATQGYCSGFVSFRCIVFNKCLVLLIKKINV